MGEKKETLPAVREALGNFKNQIKEINGQLEHLEHVKANLQERRQNILTLISELETCLPMSEDLKKYRDYYTDKLNDLAQIEKPTAPIPTPSTELLKEDVHSQLAQMLMKIHGQIKPGQVFLFIDQDGKLL